MSDNTDHDDNDDVVIEQSSGESLKSDDSDAIGEVLGVGGRDSGYGGDEDGEGIKDGGVDSGYGGDGIFDQDNDDEDTRDEE